MENEKRWNLHDVAKLVAKETDYNTEQCYEVLRCFADKVGELLCKGDAIAISRLFTVWFDFGTCSTVLTGDKEVVSVRPRIRISDGLRAAAKADK